MTYAVAILDRQWAAATRFGVELQDGRNVPTVDFRLTAGTLIRGQVTVGSPPRPLAGQHISLTEYGDPPRAGGELNERPRAHRGTRTDADGRYGLRVGPGHYEIRPDRDTELPTALNVESQPEVTRDFHFPRPPLVPLTGTVRGPKGELVAGAVVLSSPLRPTGRQPPQTTTDTQGRFAVERQPVAMLLYAHDPAGALAGTVRVGADDETAAIALRPAAKANGRVVGPDGRPRADVRLGFATMFVKQQEQEIAQFHQWITTDAAGRFEVTGLPDGATCQVRFIDGGRESTRNKEFTVRGADPVSLGDLSLPGD
jgi:hypothetical protein